MYSVRITSRVPAEDEEAVPALPADGAHEAFGNGIDPDRSPDDRDALRSENGVDGGGVNFVVPVPNQELGREGLSASPERKLLACW